MFCWPCDPVFCGKKEWLKFSGGGALSRVGSIKLSPLKFLALDLLQCIMLFIEQHRIPSICREHCSIWIAISVRDKSQGNITIRKLSLDRVLSKVVNTNICDLFHILIYLWTNSQADRKYQSHSEKSHLACNVMATSITDAFQTLVDCKIWSLHFFTPPSLGIFWNKINVKAQIWGQIKTTYENESVQYKFCEVVYKHIEFYIELYKRGYKRNVLELLMPYNFFY